MPKSADISAARSSLPEPVFHNDKHHIKIFQGDCLDILARIRADTIDLIFAGPPYFLSNDGLTCHAGRGQRIAGRALTRRDAWRAVHLDSGQNRGRQHGLHPGVEVAV